MAIFALTHPSKLPIAPASRKSDFQINYPFDEKCPLAVNLFASPRRTLMKTQVPSATFQGSYALLCEDFLSGDDLAVMLHFYQSPGEWPIGKITVYPLDAGQLYAPEQ